MQTAGRTNIRPSVGKAEDFKSLTANCHYLIMKGQLIGNLCFDGHKPTEEENRLAEQCRIVCGRISRWLDFCKVNEIPDLLEYYDIAYRIGKKSIPDTAFIARHKKRVFKAWKTGDRSVADSQIFGIVAPEVSYHPEKADREYAAAYRTLKDKWLTTLTRFDRFPDATTYENYQRLALIMRENLGSESDSLKRRWYDCNRVDELTTLGTTLLRSYRRFASSLFPHVLPYEEVSALDNRILSVLSTRPDLSLSTTAKPSALLMNIVDFKNKQSPQKI